MGTWGTLHPRPILHAPGAISVHGSVSPGKSRTQGLRYGDECLSDLATAGASSQFLQKNLIFLQTIILVLMNNVPALTLG